MIRFLDKRARAEQQLFSLGMLHARQTRTMRPIPHLAAVEWQAFSQWGEDGIIDWLVEQLPGIPETFVEFGVENYRESNTRMLLRLRNWQGLVMDGSAAHMADLQQQDIYWQHQLRSRAAFIQAENINTLLREEGLEGEIGLLSIDIDGNDYWVWQKINQVRPVLVVCEYNALWGDQLALTIPYAPDFVRQHAHPSRLYYGASIQALIDLGVEKGYTFLGTNRHGSSGFFVRDDYAALIRPLLGEIKSWPSRFREARDNRGRLTFLAGAERRNPIGHLPLINLSTGESLPIRSITGWDSEAWQS